MFKSSQIKTIVQDQLKGEFAAEVAIFDNIDRANDVIKKGAFKKSLEKWEASGAPIPVVWSHDWGDLSSHIGKITKAVETDTGLYVEGVIDIDTEKGRHVARLLKEKRIKEFSFAYDVINSKSVEYMVDNKLHEVTELLELDIIEIGPTLRGCNPKTRLIDAKSQTVEETEEENNSLNSNTEKYSYINTSLSLAKAKLQLLKHS